MSSADSVNHFSVEALIAKSKAMQQAPRRERGLWSFLTWSFFLSQLAAANAFADGAARAGQTEDQAKDAATGAQAAFSADNGASPDLSVQEVETPQADAAQALANQVAAGPSPAPANVAGVEQPFMAVDAADVAHAAQQAFGAGSSNSDEGEAAGAGRGDVADTDTPSTSGGGDPAEVVPIVLPDVGGVITPTIEAVGDLVEGVGSTLGDIFVPVVETVEDVANVLGPTLVNLLSPVGTLSDGLATAIQSALDPVSETVSSVTGTVGDLIGQPVGQIGGEIMAFADPVVDAVQPLIEPVTDLLGAAQPALDPVFQVAAPAVDLVAPVTEPLLQPLTSVTEPVLDLLPAGLGTGPLGTLLGGSSEPAAVASSGSLQFASASGPAHEVFENGTYTEFGMTLQQEPESIGSGAASAIDTVGESLATLIGGDDDAGNNLPGLLGNLQQESALRGLADGLLG